MSAELQQTIEKKQSSILGSALIVSIGNAIVYALFFFAQIVIAARIGATEELDIYLGASLLPTILISTIVNTTTVTLIPFFVSAQRTELRPQLADIRSFFMAYTIILALVVAALVVFGNPILGMLLPGYDRGQIADGVIIQYLQWPSFWLAGLCGVLQSALYANKRFVHAAIGPVLGAVTNIALTWVLVQRGQVYLTAIPLLLNVLVQFVYFGVALRLLLGATKADHQDRSEWKRFFLRSYLPLAVMTFLALFAFQASPLVDRFWGSLLGEGAITSLHYSMRIVVAIVTIVIMALSSVLLPNLSELVAKGNREQLYKLAERIMNIAAVFLVFCFVFIGFFAEPLIALLFAHGEFSSSAVQQTATALRYYSGAGVFWGLSSVLTNIYYAQKQHMRVAYLSIIAFGWQMVFIYMLRSVIQLRVVALGYSLASFVLLLMLVIQTKRESKEFDLPGLLSTLGQVGFAAGIACYSGFTLSKVISISSNLMTIIIGLLAAMVLYLVLLKIMGNQVLRQLINKKADS